MHFKRLPNETKAKQLELCKPLCGAGVGENRGCPSQQRGLGAARIAQEALGWDAWVHGDPVNLDTQKISLPVYSSYFKLKPPESASNLGPYIFRGFISELQSLWILYTRF